MSGSRSAVASTCDSWRSWTEAGDACQRYDAFCALPDEVRATTTFHLAETLDDVIRVALAERKKPVKKPAKRKAAAKGASATA